jgi:hypothetical protein
VILIDSMTRQSASQPRLVARRERTLQALEFLVCVLEAPAQTQAIARVPPAAVPNQTMCHRKLSRNGSSSIASDKRENLSLSCMVRMCDSHPVVGLCSKKLKQSSNSSMSKATGSIISPMLLSTHDAGCAAATAV